MNPLTNIHPALLIGALIPIGYFGAEILWRLWAKVENAGGAK